MNDYLISVLPSSEIAIRKALSLLGVELSNSRIPGGKLSYERSRVAPDGLDATPVFFGSRGSFHFFLLRAPPAFFLFFFKGGGGGAFFLYSRPEGGGFGGCVFFFLERGGGVKKKEAVLGSHKFAPKISGLQFAVGR